MDLTRKHIKRLKFYWQGRANGVPSLTDALDMDLALLGLIERKASAHPPVYFMITEAGMKELAQERDREIERRQPHHDLASRLAAWLRSQGRITWENVELRVGVVGCDRQSIRPDVFSLAVTYEANRINPCVYEVKVSRSDFKADIARPEKRDGYSKIAEIVYYVAPAGMIESVEVPEGFGLIEEVSVGEFQVVHKPKKRKIELTTHTFMNLIIKHGHMNDFNQI